jgi:hypothetical protein
MRKRSPPRRTPSGVCAHIPDHHARGGTGAGHHRRQRDPDAQVRPAEPVIVQTIQSTGSTFNLTVRSMKALEDAGVPKDVIEAMMKRRVAAQRRHPSPPLSRHRKPRRTTSSAARAGRVKDRAAIEEEEPHPRGGPPRADTERQKMAAEEAAELRRSSKARAKPSKDGEYYEARAKFDEFIRSRRRRSRASSGQARPRRLDVCAGALRQRGRLYHEVVNAGPENDAFVPAFEGLRAAPAASRTTRSPSRA